MIDTLAAPEAGADTDLDASGLLAELRSHRDVEHAAAARQLDLAARWADLHRPSPFNQPPRSRFLAVSTRSRSPAAVVLWSRSSASPSSAPSSRSRPPRRRSSSVTHSSCATNSHACGCRSTPDASHLWQARLVAEVTIHTSPALTREAAAWVDAQAAAVAGRIGRAQLDRLAAETIKRFDLAAADPAADPEDGYLRVDPRHATPHDEDVHFAGTMRFEAELDVADALDLNRAIAQKAEEQKALGSLESLDVRRAKALGDLARTQTALDLHPQGTTRAQTEDGLPVAREVVLHAHFDASRVGEQTVFGPTGRMEEGQRLVLLDPIQSWCGDSRTKVIIKPVIDLNTEFTAPDYDIPDRIREQVILRDGICVFPWCSRPARGCDVDHVIPYDPEAAAEGRPQPGPTATSNLAALCRRHHRLRRTPHGVTT